MRHLLSLSDWVSYPMLKQKLDIGNHRMQITPSCRMEIDNAGQYPYDFLTRHTHGDYGFQQKGANDKVMQNAVEFALKDPNARIRQHMVVVSIYTTLLGYRFTVTSYLSHQLTVLGGSDKYEWQIYDQRKTN